MNKGISGNQSSYKPCFNDIDSLEILEVRMTHPLKITISYLINCFNYNTNKQEAIFANTVISYSDETKLNKGDRGFSILENISEVSSSLISFSQSYFNHCFLSKDDLKWFVLIENDCISKYNKKEFFSYSNDDFNSTNFKLIQDDVLVKEDVESLTTTENEKEVSNTNKRENLESIFQFFKVVSPLKLLE